MTQLNGSAGIQLIKYDASRAPSKRGAKNPTKKMNEKQRKASKSIEKRAPKSNFKVKPHRRYCNNSAQQPLLTWKDSNPKRNEKDFVEFIRDQSICYHIDFYNYVLDLNIPKTVIPKNLSKVGNNKIENFGLNRIPNVFHCHIENKYRVKHRCKGIYYSKLNFKRHFVSNLFRFWCHKCTKNHFSRWDSLNIHLDEIHGIKTPLQKRTQQQRAQQQRAQRKKSLL